MRGSKVRCASAIGLAFLCAGVVAWAGRDAAGQPVAPQPPGAKKGDKDKAKDDRPARDENLPIGLPYERDAKQQLKAARDYLDFKEIPWNTVCPLLQNILDAKSDSFFDVEYKVDGETKYHRISVKTEANRIIAAFPKEGLQFYQQSYGQSAAGLLDDAVKANYDLAMLADLSQRYFHTKAGADGTALLASIHLERGNYLEAAYAFERLLGRPNPDEVMTARNLFKAALALKRSGDPKHAAMFKAVWEQLEKATRRDGLKVGTRTYTTDQLKAEADREVALVKTRATVGEWAMRLGNPARNATTDGGAPFLDPAFKPIPMLYSADDEANSWIKGQLETLFDRESTAKKYKGQPLPGFFPLTTHELVIFRSYNGVYAFAARDHVFGGKLVRAGDIRWCSESVFGVHQLMTTGKFNDVNVKQRATEWWADYLNRGGGNLLFENPLLGSLAHDGQNVYLIDDVAILPPPPMAQEFGPVNPTVGQSGALAEALRASRLVAVSLQTGKVSWELGRLSTWTEAGKPPPPPPQRLTEEEADKTTSAFALCVDAVFLGPPLPLNGRLYVLIEQAGAIRLMCLDPKVMVPVPNRPPERVPTLVWTQKLGKPNATLGQFSDRRFRGAFLAASEGIMVCPTNSGAVIGVDLMSRSLLWAHAYAKVEPPQKITSYDQNGRPIPPSLPVNRWRSAAPIIVNGRVIFTAYDSNYLECLDLRTGKLLWTVRREETDLYVGGVVNDKVLVVGKEDIRAYALTGEDEKTQTPKVAWDKVRLAPVTGHGVPGKGVFYVPVRQDGAGKDTTAAAEIWSITADTGQVHGKAVARKRTDTTELARYGLGNLVFQDGMVFAQSPYEIACYPQLEQKKAEMNARLKANPNDPIGLTDRGELLLDDGQLKAAIADFKAAETHNPPAGLERRIRDKLYIAFTELLRADFAAGEPFLKEYETLCEVPLDTDDPDEKVRRANETLERKRTFLNLMAKGREKQGRLGEAFDHYLALAQLGVDKLQPDPDDANVKMRSDVIARGRIEGMIRRADPAARKSLESRVNQQWDQVKAGTDLPRLREFVTVFGPYFPAGARGQFKLAEALLQTNTDADVREAQTHLAQIRITADDPVVRAQATEALARLMVKNGLMEDAVGLYLQLGRDYPDVPVRDGKTGADFLTDLLTDKRLLPYLEPARFPLPTRVKAEDRISQNPGNGSVCFEVEPEGELLPMFRRLRFVFDVNVAGNGLWTLRAFDRATGLERCRFTDLQPIHVQNPATMPFSKFVQASGQMLLVQLGPWVYGLDLAEKKERWRKNLLGEGVTVNPVNQTIEAGVDGEVLVKYTDGMSLTFGRSAVLQPGYVAMLTRDGLKVVDPIDGRTDLWIRKGMAEQARLYGDARYIVVVELGADRKPVATRVLRAVDGLLLEGAPDVGRVLAAAKSYRITGRNALLVEGGETQPLVLRLLDLTTGKDLWKREYDPKAVPLRALQATWTGCVKPDGTVEVLDAAAGTPVGTFRLDPDRLDAHLKGCAEAQLFADPDRIYVVLDRDTPGVVRRSNVYNFSVRCQRINGPMYCFDRGTADRLWYVEDVLDDQFLIVEQFGDLPVVMAANVKLDPTTRAYVFRVVVIEKDRGLLRLNKAFPNNSNTFHNLIADLKNGTVEVQQYNLRVIISRDDEPKQAPER